MAAVFIILPYRSMDSFWYGPMRLLLSTKQSNTVTGHVSSFSKDVTFASSELSSFHFGFWSKTICQSCFPTLFQNEVRCHDNPSCGISLNSIHSVREQERTLNPRLLASESYFTNFKKDLSTFVFRHDISSFPSSLRPFQKLSSYLHDVCVLSLRSILLATQNRCTSYW